MTDAAENNETGYCKPPKHTQFVKGQSGNPKGRPKGSRNIASLLAMEGRKRVQIRINGQVRTVTKIQAGIMQLWNKAASGDLKALQQVLFWQRSLEESENSSALAPSFEDSDKAVMTSLLKRMQNSEFKSEVGEPAVAQLDPSEGGDESCPT